jgi:hypothetical protein
VAKTGEIVFLVLGCVHATAASVIVSGVIVSIRREAPAGRPPPDDAQVHPRHAGRTPERLARLTADGP